MEKSIKFAYRSNPLARWYSDTSVDVVCSSVVTVSLAKDFLILISGFSVAFGSSFSSHPLELVVRMY